ncbi:hypothetical protein NY406_08610 [Chlorobaculum sp. MV4-Y]|jgi:hypothetical protein|uniref:hypothetical protein n=1 Tax=Chlorobaculum sp. MV4-Y TaxID=2976335 RepID=UPI0021AF45F5|nr:hypothetical protein [Chlorobaculum sp. MV4-Y]UWX57267.1 hypothetical protein NY406_08610 [Chlorobaculum sp. MV4-Y]
MVVETVPGRPSKAPALLLGTAVLVLTTTLPYLTLINAFLFAGIIIAGAVAAWYYIMRNQIRLESGEAFVLGAMSGFIGGALSVLVAYLLEKWFSYIPGLESLRLLVAWATSMAPEDAETFQQMLAMVTAPKDIALSDLLVSMILTGMFYAPFSGIGSRLTVFVLKRQARKKS